MKSVINELSHSAINTLETILANPSISRSDLFFDDPAIDSRVADLLALGLVAEDNDHLLTITEVGRAAIVDYKASTKHDRLKYWIPVIIDSVLSVSAIIISIFAILH